MKSDYQAEGTSNDARWDVWECGICKVEFNCSNVRLSISKKIYNGLVGLTGSQEGRCGRRSGFDGIFFFRIKVSFRRFDFRFPELTNKASSSTFPLWCFLCRGIDLQTQ